MPDTPAVSPILLALYRGDAATVATLRAERPALDLFEAAALGDVDSVRGVLDAAPDAVNSRASDGFSAVALAAFFGQDAVVELLLQRGADPNVPADNPMRVTALHAAVAGQHTEIALTLLDNGADASAVQQAGWTPLHQAADHGDTALVAALLAAGASASATNDAGVTARSLAEAKGHTAVLALLG